MTHQEFVKKWVGKSIDNDGYPIGATKQCTDLVATYIKEVWGQPMSIVFPANAIDIIDRHNDNYETIKNDFNDINQVPLQGDIIVFGATPSNPYGHTGIVDSANGQKVTVFEQNAGGGRGQGQGGDACTLRDHTYWASAGFGEVLGWLRLKNNSNMFDKNQSINDFAKKWNNKLKPFWADDGNEFGAIRGRWYNGDYAGALDPFAQEIINLQALVAEKDKQLLEAPEAGVVESLQAKEDEITKLKDKITELEARPNIQAVSVEEIAEKTSSLTLEKIRAEGTSAMANIGAYVTTNLPRWKRTLFDSLQVLLPTIGAILVFFGISEGSLLTGDLSSPDSWVAIIGAVTTVLGVKQIDDKNKRKIAEEIAKNI